MDDEFELDEGNEENILIIAGAAAILSVTVILTMCFVIQKCWCHRFCSKRGRNNSTSSETIILEITKRKASVKFKEKVPVYESVESRVQNGKGVPNVVSDTSPSLYNGYVIPTAFLQPQVSTIPPVLLCTVHYSSEKDSTALGRLKVRILNCENLPPRDYPTLVNCSVQLSIVHRKWSFGRHDSSVHEAQTRVVPNTNSPSFEQNFIFAAAESDIKSWSLRFGILDEDKNTRSREICHGKINLRDIKTLKDEDQAPLLIGLEPTTAVLGQVLVTLNYLPTAQRLSINVVKAVNLRWQESTSSLDTFCVNARVLLMDHAGHLVKRKRISGERGTNSPSFTGTALFLAPPMLLATATVLIQVYNENMNEAEEENSRSKRNIIGYCAVGWMVHDNAGRDQWQSVLLNPRRVVSQWLDLK